MTNNGDNHFVLKIRILRITNNIVDSRCKIVAEKWPKVIKGNVKVL